jgi:hypothetical protein
MSPLTSQRQTRRDLENSGPAVASIARRTGEGGPAVHRAPRLAWWVNPTWVLLLVLLPILLLTLSEGPAGLLYFKNFVDNFTPYNCFLAVASLLALTCGTIVPRLVGASPTYATSLEPLRVTLVLRWLGIVALAAYALFLGTWFLHPELVLQALQGGGTEAARQALSRLPGITSFTNVAPLFCAVWAAARLDPRFRPTTELKCIFVALTLFTLARAIVGSERLALIEFIAPLVLAQAAFHWRPSLVRAAFPLFGFVGLIGFFAIAEYFRSWQYYQYLVGLGFWEFSALRLVGYFSTALNNGMGMFHIYAPLYQPFFTAGAIDKLPIWHLAGIEPSSVTENIWGIYLFEVGNPEFNNLSGLFVPLIDFGPAIGLTIMFSIGIGVGLLYRSYSQQRIAGLLLYPTCYLGTLEVIRLFYFGESRIVPIFLAAGLVGWFLRPTRQVQARFVSRASTGLT